MKLIKFVVPLAAAMLLAGCNKNESGSATGGTNAPPAGTNSMPAMTNTPPTH